MKLKEAIWNKKTINEINNKTINNYEEYFQYWKFWHYAHNNCPVMKINKKYCFNKNDNNILKSKKHLFNLKYVKLLCQVYDFQKR